MLVPASEAQASALGTILARLMTKGGRLTIQPRRFRAADLLELRDEALEGDEIVAAAAERRHAADCGCGPCGAVREVLKGKGWRPARRALHP